MVHRTFFSQAIYWDLKISRSSDDILPYKIFYQLNKNNKGWRCDRVFSQHTHGSEFDAQHHVNTVPNCNPSSGEMEVRESEVEANL